MLIQFLKIIRKLLWPLIKPIRLELIWSGLKLKLKILLVLTVVVLLRSLLRKGRVLMKLQNLLLIRRCCFLTLQINFRAFLPLIVIMTFTVVRLLILGRRMVVPVIKIKRGRRFLVKSMKLMSRVRRFLFKPRQMNLTLGKQVIPLFLLKWRKTFVRVILLFRRKILLLKFRLATLKLSLRRLVVLLLLSSTNPRNRGKFLKNRVLVTLFRNMS